MYLDQLRARWEEGGRPGEGGLAWVREEAARVLS